MTNTKRYFIQLSYNGKNYHGWQYQPNAISIQEVIDKAFSTLLSEKIEVVGAGRTDTGVHASFYIAHFDSVQELVEIPKLIFRLNRFLPIDIAVQSIREVKANAHARFDAISRTYEYKISLKKSPFTNDFTYLIHEDLDVDKMNEACKSLFNYIDFSSFSKLHSDTKTNNCKIYEANWTRKNDMLIFRIKADRFLRNMVRAIVGTMIDVGRNKLSIADFQSIIESKDRSKAGFSVPGNALFLVDIEYNF